MADFSVLPWPPKSSSSQILSDSPRIALIEGVLSSTTCSALRALTESTVVSSAFTSSAIFHGDDPAITLLLEELDRQTGFRAAGLVAEPPSLTRYDSNGTGYGWHTDGGAADPPVRAATAIFYLNTVSPGGGGETVFPFAKVNGVCETSYECDRPLPDRDKLPPCDEATSGANGVEVRPREGSLLLFVDADRGRDNEYPQGREDPFSLHGARKTKGSAMKYICQVWLRGLEGAPWATEKKEAA